ncbi:pectin lyase fold/virulence factor [Dendryphion nanum]|uniref:Pectin lyase fold/virulence factor n=1 Tax=Dendryphion nanum TaxID=256645 RepID=A0A9P9E6H1_9PLEO|nr:pectin lyase fold/virulence factor [Dendryphion nanum]
MVPKSSFVITVALLVAVSLAAPSNKYDCDRVYPGQSIQKAIDRARPGDRIEVYGGTYQEQLTIKKSGIQLVGKNGATLRPPAKFCNNLCSGLSQTLDKKETEAGICIHGKGIELDKYEAEHRKVKSVGAFIENVSVTGFTVIGFDGENIALVGGKNTKISNNTLIDGGRYGFLTAGSKGTTAESNTISTTPLNFIAMCQDDYADAVFANNVITGYFTGLCSQTPGGLATKNNVTNVCVGGAADPGVNGAQIIDNFISTRRNDCEAMYGVGIIVYGAIESIIKDNTIEKINNNGVGVGIYVTKGPKGEVATGNVIRKNTLRANDFDIYDDSTGVNDFGSNVCTTGSVPPNACV